MTAELLATVNGIDLLFFLAGAAIMWACCWPAIRRRRTARRYSEDELQRRLFEAREDAWDRGWRAHATVTSAVESIQT